MLYPQWMIRSEVLRCVIGCLWLPLTALNKQSAVFLIIRIIPRNFNKVGFVLVYVNVNIFVSVCNAGYYRDGSACLLCTDDKIKTLAGNEPHCDTDQPCDGVSTVSNENHTACGN